MNNASSHILEENPDALAKRLIQKAHLNDGLVEIAIGLISLTMVGSFYLQDFWFWRLFALLGPSYAFHFLNLCLGIGPIFVVFLGSMQAMKWLRLHYLIDRVGYVEVKPMNRKQFLIAVLAFNLMAIALCAFFMRIPHRERWLVFLAGLSFGAVLLLLKRTRFVIGGMLIGAAGVLLAFSRVSLQASLAILSCFFGLLALISGSVVLARLLRQPTGSDR